MPEEEKYFPLNGRTSNKNTVVKPINLHPDTQTLVSVQYKKAVLIFIELNEILNTNHVFIEMNCVECVKATETLRIIIAKLGKHPPMMTEGQVVGNSEPHPTSITESNSSMAKTLGMVDEKDPKKGHGSDYFEDLNLALSTKPSNRSNRKRKVNTKDLDTIKIHLKDEKERTIVKEEQPTIAETVELGVLEKYHETIR